jgi:hypothetical protein
MNRRWPGILVSALGALWLGADARAAVQLNREFNVRVPVVIPAHGSSWFVIE